MKYGIRPSSMLPTLDSDMSSFINIIIDWIHTLHQPPKKSVGPTNRAILTGRMNISATRTLDGGLAGAMVDTTRSPDDFEMRPCVVALIASLRPGIYHHLLSLTHLRTDVKKQPCWVSHAVRTTDLRSVTLVILTAESRSLV